jgi:hypothetical protein
MDEFSNHGKVESIRILRHKFCAFVNFEDEAGAKNARKALDKAIFGSQYIKINFRKVTNLHLLIIVFYVTNYLLNYAA